MPNPMLLLHDFDFHLRTESGHYPTVEIFMSAVYSTRPAGALFVIVCVLAFNNLAALLTTDSIVYDSIHCLSPF